MFFESHQFAAPARNFDQAKEYHKTAEITEHAPRILQSVMLGSIPGRDTKLTMIAVLSYPDNSDDIYPDAFEALGSKFSILKPGRDMVQKLLYVAEQAPPVPSSDFWNNSNSALAKNINNHTPEKKAPVAWVPNHKKQMPDVTGKSLRAGLQTLQHYNLDIRLVGNGKIVSQHPAAGSELKNGSECILKMQQEI